jgi:hypothetical protein
MPFAAFPADDYFLITISSDVKLAWRRGLR